MAEGGGGRVVMLEAVVVEEVALSRPSKTVGRGNDQRVEISEGGCNAKRLLFLVVRKRSGLE